MGNSAKSRVFTNNEYKAAVLSSCNYTAAALFVSGWRHSDEIFRSPRTLTHKLLGTSSGINFLRSCFPPDACPRHILRTRYGLRMYEKVVLCLAHYVFQK